ncbi:MULTISPECIES: SusC/RagA family TonB-linked outer membrane protein [unclassified Spirosoma]|uniref:SusC/RagA family TonB-linked outer membrane protein n=1 Tax=unclassified Spirosoma TaxID=2621999 RepID=UPI00095A1FD1|nr:MULTISPECIES: SusC/RagA family TonB-linked outer membrane protein [unclassified Spirosoma]MBN8826483.1 SusC/RagA family TonB-linked outer membrane protein [Spirosoma sp.]OJW76425.1 MAG: SusC/RagA family protein [Spirosoma sp. 48-14]
MMRKLLMSMLLTCSLLISSWAQDRKIRGRVTAAEDGAPIPGASVVLKGTSRGVNTDADGNYSISVSDGGKVLIFSFVGTAAQEIEIGNRSTIDIQLVADAKSLQEVVVTAQGIVREKKALGYAVTTLDNRSIEDRPQADVGRILQGKIPGVNITATSGVSGTGTNINIRGFSSITGSTQPLFVVDGVPFNSSTNSRGGFTGGGQSASSRFLDIDPNNIENISVLKGLAATVTYGDQGRNGVILVTTKNGSKKARPTEITLTQSVFTNKANLPSYQNDYVGGFQQNLGYFFSNFGPTLTEALAYPSQNTNTALTQHPYAFLTNATLRAAMAPYVASLGQYQMQVYPDNVKDFFRTGVISNTSLNLSGGNERVGYNLSVGYNREQGYIPENGLTRLNIGAGIRAQLNKKLSINSSFNFANTDQFTPPLNAGTGNNTLSGFPSVLANVLYTPRQVDLMGWPFENPVDGGTVYFRSGNDIPNPRWILKNYKTTDVVNRFFTTTNLTYDIAKNLVLLYKVGLDTYNENQEYKFNKGGVDFVNGFYNTYDIKNTIWDNSLIVSYTRPMGDHFTVSGRLGGNMRNDKTNSTFVSSQNQLARNLFRHSNFIDNVASNGEVEQTRIGVFGEITADVNDYLYLNLAARNDWTSTVEVPNRQIFYPSGSISFVPTSAFSGLQGSKLLSFLKLRAGIGTSAGFPYPYSTRNVLNQSARGWLNSSGTTVQTHSVDNTLGNPNLKPELHTEIEFGLEGRLLSNRVSFDITAYQRNTRDLITNSPLDASTGYTATTINIGKIRNEGIEISLSGTAIKRGDFAWDLTGVFSRNVPKVLDLGGTLQEVQIAGFGGGLGNYAVVGKPFNLIKGTGYRRNDQGQLQIDASGNLLTTTSPVELGNPNPAFTSSLINEFKYKSLTLSVMLSYRHGGAMYSSTAGALLGRGLVSVDNGKLAGTDRAQTIIVPGVKNADGTVNDVQVTASDFYFNNYYFFGDEGRIFDGSTIRLQEVSLAWQLPKKALSKLSIKGASLSLFGNNLWYRALYFPKNLNFDTDNLGLGVGNGLGFEFLTGPSARRLGGTLKITF